MERIGKMDEYGDEEKEARYNLITTTINIVEKDLGFGEDFICDCQDLISSYIANFINAPSKQFVIKDEQYIAMLNETNLMVQEIDRKPFEMRKFYMFCKNVVRMMSRLDEIESESDISNMMANLSVKTNRRKLKR
jgi:hypothetical protein